MRLGSDNSGNRFIGNISHVWMDDSFLDLHIAANHDSVIALDGHPPDLGVDGSNLTGTQPRIYITGNAADWNDAGGINLGADSKKFAIGAGAVTDAAAYSAEAEAYFAAMSVEPDAKRKGIIDTLITDLKAAGWWDKGTFLYLFAAHDEQAARVNLRDPSKIATNAGSVNATFTTDRGFKGGSNIALDLQYLLNDFTQNDNHFALHIGEDGTSGIDLSAAARMFMYSRTGGNFHTRNMSATGHDTAVGSSLGQSLMTRSAEASYDVYKNGASLATISQTSAATNDEIIYALAFSPTSTPSPLMNQSVYAGQALTAQEVADTNAAMEAYLDAIGAPMP